VRLGLMVLLNRIMACFETRRSPLTPLNKGGQEHSMFPLIRRGTRAFNVPLNNGRVKVFKVPRHKGDLGGSESDGKGKNTWPRQNKNANDKYDRLCDLGRFATPLC
jgi:hypothetical protein